MKRLFDFSVAFIFSILFTPLWLLVAIAIKVESNGPIFFRQIRIGLKANPFTIFKFRTMVVDAEKKGLQITVGGHDPRITKVGYLLRKTKLDELPQLFNIVIGEMSFVGPRPDLPGYADNLKGKDRKILELRPGITSVASLKYANEESILAAQENPLKFNDEVIYFDKVKLNLDYYYNNNLWVDIKIIFATIFRVNY